MERKRKKNKHLKDVAISKKKEKSQTNGEVEKWRIKKNASPTKNQDRNVDHWEKSKWQRKRV